MNNNFRRLARHMRHSAPPTMSTNRMLLISKPPAATARQRQPSSNQPRVPPSACTSALMVCRFRPPWPGDFDSFSLSHFPVVENFPLAFSLVRTTNRDLRTSRPYSKAIVIESDASRRTRQLLVCILLRQYARGLSARQRVSNGSNTPSHTVSSRSSRPPK